MDGQSDLFGDAGVRFHACMSRHRGRATRSVDEHTHTVAVNDVPRD